MAVQKVFVAPDYIGLEPRERIVARRALRPQVDLNRWTFRKTFGGLIAYIAAAMDALNEAQRMRRDAERRYPHISFDT
jgi:hypothetical protein